MTNFQKNGVDINSLIFKDDANGSDRQNIKVGSIDANGNITATNQTITAGTFSGNLTGNVTGNCTGSSGSCTGNALTSSSCTGNALTSSSCTGNATGLSGTPAITVGAVISTTITTNNNNINAGTGTVTASEFSGNATGLTGTPAITVGNLNNYKIPPGNSTQFSNPFILTCVVVKGARGSTSINTTVPPGYYIVLGYRCDNLDDSTNASGGGGDWDLKHFIYFKNDIYAAHAYGIEEPYAWSGNGGNLTFNRDGLITYTVNDVGTNYHIEIKYVKIF